MEDFDDVLEHVGGWGRYQASDMMFFTRRMI